MRALRALTAAAAVAVTGILPAAASAAPPEPAAYVALGDSVAAGVAAAPGSGYVPLLAADLRADRACGQGQALGCRLELVNLAEAGADSGDLLTEQLPAALALIEAREATPPPVDDVRLVTVTIGANDLLRPALQACADGPTPQCLATVAGGLTAVDANLEATLEALRAAGGPDLTIVVSTYYNPLLPPCGTQALAATAQAVLEGVPGGPLAEGLNGILRREAAAVGARVVETAPVIGPEHVAADCIHPDTAGHAAIAEAFGAALSDLRLTRPGHGR